jgi:DNA-directed RNA polymerase sigma subunit (sigma70/sigma32)
VAKERVERDEEDLVRLYLTDIGQYPLLTKDDEVRLAQEIEGGNEARLQLETAKKLDAKKKRELRKTATTPSARSCSRTFDSSCRSRRSTRRPACRCST